MKVSAVVIKLGRRLRRTDLTDGRWVTINGAHVFIKTGISVEQAMIYKTNKVSGPIDGDAFSAERFSEKLKKKVTPDEVIDSIGDPELKNKVIETEKKLESLVSTYDRHWVSGKDLDAVFDEERSKKHEEWIDKYLNDSKHVGKDAICSDDEQPTLTLLGGRGGSGKSNFDGLVYDREKVIVIDADEVKKLIPEYKEWNAFQVHEESSYLMKRIVKEAMESRMNVVIDQTMSKEKQSQKYLDTFKEAGYRTEAHYMFLPPQESVKRGMTRFRDDGKNGKYTGRFVPRKVLGDMNENEKVFDNIKGQVDNWSFYSNYGVKKGSKPILISKKVL